MGKKRLGDVLVQSGCLAEEDLNRAIAVHQEKAMRLGEVLLEEGMVSKKDIAKAIELVQGVPYVECPPPSIAPEVLALLPRSIALRCCALPLQDTGKELVVAMAEPQNLVFLDELMFKTRMIISPRFSFRADILAGIRKFYIEECASNADLGMEGEPEAESLGIEFLTTSLREENREALKELQAGMRQRTPAVQYVSNILAGAAQRGASDIHVEPRVGHALVRLRVDGILSELMSIPGEHQASVISRIKILADMDIGERRIPQDGRFLMQYRGRRIDLRVSTLPTHFGEKVVLRLLDPQSALISLADLGLSQRNSDGLQQILALPQGTLIVTGPTGSGKTTTLYAALHLLCSPGRNLVTVEDPIEYMLEGVNQAQVNPKAGLTFSGCLASILRQDPNVIMVGEIRDGETADLVLRASLTGHFVLSTLHTNDSVSAIIRLLDLGVPPYLVASAVSAVMAQRLVRKLCACREMGPAASAHKERLTSLGYFEEGEGPMYQPVGCSLCNQTGYKGRVAIYELLVFDEHIRAAIHLSARPDEIRILARDAGFKTMQDDAIEKVKEGLTTLAEVLRVVPFETGKVARCLHCLREFAPAFPYCPFCGTSRGIAAAAEHESEVLI